mmetsp:Transcript_20943/g.44003  ORF Transcript_20943/g.44003 Transcript_20943/m.44003 type:complete len:236 (-) Transcript_20943:324-1031(-)
MSSTGWRAPAETAMRLIPAIILITLGNLRLLALRHHLLLPDVLPLPLLPVATLPPQVLLAPAAAAETPAVPARANEAATIIGALPTTETWNQDSKTTTTTKKIPSWNKINTSKTTSATVIPPAPAPPTAPPLATAVETPALAVATEETTAGTPTIDRDPLSIPINPTIAATPRIVPDRSRSSQTLTPSDNPPSPTFSPASVPSGRHPSDTFAIPPSWRGSTSKRWSCASWEWFWS